MAYLIRAMTEGDIPQVVQVERDAFPTQWPGTPFRRELQNRLARYLVAAEDPPRDTISPVDNKSLIETAHSNSNQTFVARWISGIKRVLAPASQMSGNGNEPSPLILGFVGLWFMVDEAHITSIGVREVFRRQGIGELLLISAIDLAVRRECRIVTLEVRVSNTPAQSLYEKYGFTKLGVRKGYYTDNHEDAYVMSTSVITSPAYESQLQRLKEAHKARWGDNLRILV